MQVFRDVVVKEVLILDEKSKPFLQRKHFVKLTSGFATGGEAAAAGNERAAAVPRLCLDLDRISAAKRAAGWREGRRDRMEACNAAVHGRVQSLCRAATRARGRGVPTWGVRTRAQSAAPSLRSSSLYLCMRPYCTFHLWQCPVNLPGTTSTGLTG